MHKTQNRGDRRHQPIRALLVTAMIGLVTGSVSFPQLASADVYQYVDANGTIALTNVPSDPRYRRVTAPLMKAPQSLSPRELDPMISKLSRQHHLHPALIRAVIKAESDFDPLAVSRAGAVGLMQLMPQTAVRLHVYDLYDPEDNIGGGTKYLRQLLDRFSGNLPLALAAYNAGEHAVDRYHGLPPIDETRQYVRRVIRYYRTFLMADPQMAGHVIAPSQQSAQALSASTTPQ